MPFLPLQEKPFINVDESARQGLSQFLDAAKDDYMGNIRRPGLNKWVNLGPQKPVDGLYEWLYQNIAVAVCGGEVYRISESGATKKIESANPLFEGVPVSFADFGDTLYMANGGQILKWKITDDTASFIQDPDAPTSVTHIVFINRFLVALDTTQNAEALYYSAVNDPSTWDGSFFTAEYRPDKPNALHTGWEELMIAGETTVENWYNSGGAAVFSRVKSGNIERGTFCPYTIQKIDNSYWFLDYERKVIKLTNRSPQVISNPFDEEFQRMYKVSDAIGMHINPNGETFYVITFPTEGRTFAYDYKRDVWAEWSYWNQTDAQRENYLGRVAAYMRKWDRCLIGSQKADGLIYTADMDYFKDDRQNINFEVYTGWNNYKSDKWKNCYELRVKLKRGTGGAFNGKVFEVYYRDNGNKEWSTPRYIDLGQLGDDEHIFRIRRLGRYRSRQWRFRCAEDVGVNLISAEEVVK